MEVTNLLNVPVVGFACNTLTPSKKYDVKVYEGSCSNDRVVVFEKTADVDTVQAATPTAGGTVTISDSNYDTTVILTPAGTLATLTVVLPAAPFNGQRVLITSTQIVTALTLDDGAANTSGATTALAVNTAVEYVYRASNTTWYKIR